MFWSTQLLLGHRSLPSLFLRFPSQPHIHPIKLPEKRFVRPTLMFSLHMCEQTCALEQCTHGICYIWVEGEHHQSERGSRWGYNPSIPVTASQLQLNPGFLQRNSGLLEQALPIRNYTTWSYSIDSWRIYKCSKLSLKYIWTNVLIFDCYIKSHLITKTAERLFLGQQEEDQHFFWWIPLEFWPKYVGNWY